MKDTAAPQSQICHQHVLDKHTVQQTSYANRHYLNIIPVYEPNQCYKMLRISLSMAREYSREYRGRKICFFRPYLGHGMNNIGPQLLWSLIGSQRHPTEPCHIRWSWKMSLRGPIIWTDLVHVFELSNQQQPSKFGMVTYVGERRVSRKPANPT